MQAVQFGEIDALAIKAEAPAEGRDQKADRDDAPAVVAGRGLVEGDVTGLVHARLFLRIKTTMLAGGGATIIRAAPNCLSRARSGFRPGRIVKESLAENPVAAPFLQRDLVDPMNLAGTAGQLENPVNGNPIAFDHRRHRLRINVATCAQEWPRSCATSPSRPTRGGARVLLHAGSPRCSSARWRRRDRRFRPRR